MQQLCPRSAAACVALAAVACIANAQETPVSSVADPLERPVEVMTMADRSLLLDIVRAGERYVAVGERGHVLVSADGAQWTQSANVPLRGTLTATTAVGTSVWAVGHDGVILHSADAGDTWSVQRRDPWRVTGDDEDEPDLRMGVPLLDVLFTDADNGIAIGAYSLYLTTADGGKTWTGSRIPVKGEDAASAASTAQGIEDDADLGNGSDTFSAEELRIGQESDPHLNAIARTGSGALVIVGERGAVFHSRDGGASWERSQLPYDGSMFGVVGYEGEHVLAFGLRGNVYESTDLGTTWTEVATATELSLMGGVALADGGAVIVGANGTILHRARADAPLKRSTATEAGVLAGVLPIDADGLLLIAGENGITRYQPK